MRVSFMIALLFVLLSGVVRAAPPAVIVVYGDSLSAGHGMRIDQAWPALLQTRLNQNGGKYQVINASASGETTAGGLTRLPAVLAEHKPVLVILELGANDGLRGLPLDIAQQNLGKMIKLVQASGARVHVVGMMIPPNMGPDYTKAFAAMYPALAQQYKTTITPFLLAPVITKPELFMADQLHPIPAGEPPIADEIYRDIQPALAPAAGKANTKKRAG